MSKVILRCICPAPQEWLWPWQGIGAVGQVSSASADRQEVDRGRNGESRQHYLMFIVSLPFTVEHFLVTQSRFWCVKVTWEYYIANLPCKHLVFGDFNLCWNFIRVSQWRNLYLYGTNNRVYFYYHLMLWINKIIHNYFICYSIVNNLFTLFICPQKKFIKGLRLYGKNFFRIRKELLPHKETVSYFLLQDYFNFVFDCDINVNIVSGTCCLYLQNHMMKLFISERLAKVYCQSVYIIYSRVTLNVLKFII